MRINRWCGWASLGIVRASETENGSKSKCIFGVSGYRRSYPILMISRCRTFSTWKHLFYWAEHEWFELFFPPFRRRHLLQLKLLIKLSVCVYLLVYVWIMSSPPHPPPSKNKPLISVIIFGKCEQTNPKSTCTQNSGHNWSRFECVSCQVRESVNGRQQKMRKGKKNENTK